MFCYKLQSLYVLCSGDWKKIAGCENTQSSLIVSIFLFEPAGGAVVQSRIRFDEM